MRFYRQTLLAFFAVLICAPLHSQSVTLELSADQFVEMVLTKSLNTQNIKNSFRVNESGYFASRREILFPNLSLTSQASRSKSIQETAATLTDSASNNLELAQPFIWGGNLSIAAAQETSQATNEASNAATTQTFSRNFPKFSVTYQQPLFIFTGNQRWRTWKRNLLNFKNQSGSFQLQLQSIEFDARAQYDNAVIALERLNVEKQKLKSSQLLFNITQAWVESGRIAQVELMRAQINKKLDERRLRNAEISAQQALNSLKNLVLIPENQEVVLVSTFTYKPLRVSLETLQNTALQYRLDLQNARQNIELSELAIKETREQNFPQMNASAGYRIDYLETSQRPENWNILLSMNWKLFDSGINSLSVDQKKLALENSKRDLELLKRQVKLEVENAYLDVTNTQEQIDDFSETRQQALANIEAVRLRYERGIDRLIDVFDAENSLRSLEIEYLALVSTFNNSKNKLSLLVGKRIGEIEKNEKPF